MKLRELAVLSSISVLPALDQDRMPPIPSDQQTPAQQKAIESLATKRMHEAQRRGLVAKVEPLVSGPFVPLSRSPALMNSFVSVREALETNSPLPQKLIEMTIIMTSRQLTSQCTWNSGSFHSRFALEETQN